MSENFPRDDLNHGSGSWHPARRPDSLQLSSSLDKQHGSLDLQPPRQEKEPYLPILSSEPSLTMPPTTFSSQFKDPLTANHSSKGSEPSLKDFLPESVNGPKTGQVTDGPKRDDEEEIQWNVQRDASSSEPPILPAAQSALRLSQLDDIDNTEDIRFPEYMSYVNEEASIKTQHPSNEVADGKIEEDFSQGMDAAWEIGHNGAGMDRNKTINRTDSFPVVPPLHQVNAILPQVARHSPVEDVLEEVKKEKCHESVISDSSLLAVNGGEAASQPNLIFDRADEEIDFFTTSCGIQDSELQLPADEEARFEEGLPLISSEPNETELKKEVDLQRRTETSSPKWSNTSEDNFFKDDLMVPTEDISFFKPQPLDRKSTSQVLDSLCYAPNLAKHDLSQEFQADINPRSNAAPVETLLPPDSSNNNERETVLSLEDSRSQRIQEEELTAMWQAALGDDELLEDGETSFDPSAFFDDDGEGFLDDNSESKTKERRLDQLTPNGNGSVQGSNFANPGIRAMNPSQPQSNSSAGYLPERNTVPISEGPQQTSNAISQSLSGPAGFRRLPTNESYFSHGTAWTRPQLPKTTQSFSDKSKGGYTSPYDLPMEVIRPKKRTYLQQTQSISEPSSLSRPVPPPRNSNMHSAGTSPVVESNSQISDLSRPNASLQALNSRTPSANTSAVLKSQRSVGSFFEELPSSKPRPSSSRGKSVLGNTHIDSPPQAPFHNEPPSQPALMQSPPLNSSRISQGYKLLPPERMGIYAQSPEERPREVSTVNSTGPATQMPRSVPPARNRYASSPNSGPRPSPSQSMSYQPRTSSPLAQNLSVSQDHPRNSAGDVPREPQQNNRSDSIPAPKNDASLSSQAYDRNNMLQDPNVSVKPISSADPTEFTRPSPYMENRYAPTSRSPSKPPNALQHFTPNNLPPAHQSDPSFAPLYAQQNSDVSPESAALGPLRRSQTQSPGAVRSKAGPPSNMPEPLHRSASTNYQDFSTHSNLQHGIASHQSGLRERSLPQRSNYITPTDGREHDPLERWKGCPVITFGFGGAIVTSFPKRVPRYSTGQAIPLIKCSPGEVRLELGKTFQAEGVTTFPGPLRSKSKKKDVIDWLQKRIGQLEETPVPHSLEPALPSPQTRHEEKILLWRILQLMVNSDGFIEGNSAAMIAARILLSPELAPQDNGSLAASSFNQDIVGISRHGEPIRPLEPVDPNTIEYLRQLLLQGEREKAVWYAVDQRSWDHAMLLSSTLDPSVWKQVLQEFIRQEVKTLGKNTESLASLYQVFAGNWDESVDELVPPSARAGLQMVSKVMGAGPAKNSLDGLDRWRETLTLILSNRTRDDMKALLALGRLLSTYGRVEAAHICYIFAKSPGIFGGADDPQAVVALVGADHFRYPFDYGHDLDGILLTEIHEFASTVLAPSTAISLSPHLQSFKLYHALILADCGLRSEAQQYCDAVTSTLKSTTKLSPYYHSILFGVLEDLVERLRQAPKDGSASWMSKPSMDKVSGSVWAKFNQFIAGDESDGGSAVSAKALDHDAGGSFARISTESPGVSRPPSSNDLYNTYPMNGGTSGAIPSTNTHISRYTPAGQYTPRSSLEQAKPWPSEEPRRQSDSEGLTPFVPHQQYQAANDPGAETHPELPSTSYKRLPLPSTYSSQSHDYTSIPLTQPEYPSSVPPPNTSSSLYNDESFKPSPTVSQLDMQPNHLTADDTGSNSDYKPPPQYNPSSAVHETLGINSYEPPTSTYEPPLGDPDTSIDNESPSEEKPKKRSFMDDDADDEDFAAQTAAAANAEKSRKDKEADEAFRKAAEADGTYKI